MTDACVDIFWWHNIKFMCITSTAIFVLEKGVRVSCKNISISSVTTFFFKAAINRLNVLNLSILRHLCLIVDCGNFPNGSWRTSFANQFHSHCHKLQFLLLTKKPKKLNDCSCCVKTPNHAVCHQLHAAEVSLGRHLRGDHEGPVQGRPQRRGRRQHHTGYVVSIILCTWSASHCVRDQRHVGYVFNITLCTWSTSHWVRVQHHTVHVFNVTLGTCSASH